jgi:hypothetical protein
MQQQEMHWNIKSDGHVCSSKKCIGQADLEEAERSSPVAAWYPVTGFDLVPCVNTF